jgi:hypothetical protein
MYSPEVCALAILTLCVYKQKVREQKLNILKRDNSKNAMHHDLRIPMLYRYNYKI